jgi:hypothetical protein
MTTRGLVRGVGSRRKLTMLRGSDGELSFIHDINDSTLSLPTTVDDTFGALTNFA